MIEYKIETSSSLDKVKKIWRKFLKDDSTWHFTCEGSYIELRVADNKSARWTRDFKIFLEKNKWKYTTFPYKDNIQITRKYQKQFEKIFHGFSELAMILPPKKKVKGSLQDASVSGSDFSLVAERVVHLFYNINGFDVNSEAYHLAQTLVGRAYTAGWYSALYPNNNSKEK